LISGRSTGSRAGAVKSVAVLTLVVLTLAACSGAAERTLIAQFFAASRLRDLTALRSLATIVFEPKTDGIVNDFELLRIDSVPQSGSQPPSKRALIAAPVRTPDGKTVPTIFVVTMQHGLPGSEPRWGGWMITAIQAVPASPSIPRS
jgi:hypothetical protein